MFAKGKKNNLLFLLSEHAEIKVDKFQVAGGCGVVSSFQLVVESF